MVRLQDSHLIAKRAEKLGFQGLAKIRGPLVAHPLFRSVAWTRTHDRATFPEPIRDILIRLIQWVAVMTLVSFKARDTTIGKVMLKEDEAGTRLEHVIADRRRAGTASGQERRDLAAAG